MGPFELLDLIGLDVSLAAQRSLYEAFGRERLRPAALLEKLVAAGDLGRKARRGFYDYSRALSVGQKKTKQRECSAKLVGVFARALLAERRLSCKNVLRGARGT